jgi:hypothetical protein
MAGIAYIKADGVQFEVKGNIECPLTQMKREVVMGLAGPMGHKETAREQYVKFDAGFTADFPVNMMNNITNATITVEYANGMVYTLTGAFETGEGGANGEEGSVGMYFSGMNGVWS